MVVARGLQQRKLSHSMTVERALRFDLVRGTNVCRVRLRSIAAGGDGARFPMRSCALQTMFVSL